MSNIKITIEGVEKEYEVTPTHKHNVENDTFFRGDWYREVEPVKQDYEILSFRSVANAIWIKINGNFETELANGYVELSDMLNYCKTILTIYSVKRLSDGEVFTVGEDEKKIGKISIIELVIDEIFLHSAGCLVRLANAEKVKAAHHPINYGGWKRNYKIRSGNLLD